jgi:hypothetical protein
MEFSATLSHTKTLCTAGRLAAHQQHSSARPLAAMAVMLRARSARARDTGVGGAGVQPRRTTEDFKRTTTTDNDNSASVLKKMDETCRDPNVAA